MGICYVIQRTQIEPLWQLEGWDGAGDGGGGDMGVPMSDSWKQQNSVKELSFL